MDFMYGGISISEVFLARRRVVLPLATCSWRKHLDPAVLRLRLTAHICRPRISICLEELACEGTALRLRAVMHFWGASRGIKTRWQGGIGDFLPRLALVAVSPSALQNFHPEEAVGWPTTRP